MRRPPRGAITAICLVVLAVAAVQVRLPWFVERPLEPLELTDSLEVDGQTAAADDGAYLVALVGRRRATVLSAAAAMVRGDQRLRPAAEVIPFGVDDAVYRRRHREVFDRSVEQAAAAALATLGRPVSRRAGGVVVVDVVGGSPADDRLRVDDVILTVNGESTTTPSRLREVVTAAEGRVRVVVERDGDERTLRLRPAPVEAGGERRVGLGAVTRVAAPRLVLPVDVSVDGRGTTGSSAGLMVALAVFDLLDEDRRLAAGRRVAGTGGIGSDGRVMPVSAVATKVRAARRAGADVFVVPTGQRARATRAADGEVEVVGVRTLADAVDALDDGG